MSLTTFRLLVTLQNGASLHSFRSQSNWLSTYRGCTNGPVQLSFCAPNGGKFILRIEDTDRERSTPEAIKAILDAMNWLGLDWDEGPFYQTERYPLYKKKIQQLLAEGKAYPCICTSVELDAKRQQAQKEKRKPCTMALVDRPKG